MKIKLLVIFTLAVLITGCYTRTNDCRDPLNYNLAVNSIILNFKPWSMSTFELKPNYIKTVKTKDDGTKVCRIKLESEIIDRFREEYPEEFVSSADIELSFETNEVFRKYLLDYILDKFEIRSFYDQKYKSAEHTVNVFVKLLSYFLEADVVYEIGNEAITAKFSTDNSHRELIIDKRKVN